MTVSYDGSFVGLLLRWRGSVWKSLYKELSIFLVVYYLINFIYRFTLTETQVEKFEKLVNFCDKATGYIPLLFLLGFYVTLIIGRWWEQFMYISWPDRFMGFLTTYLVGSSDEMRMIRRTIARWLNLSALLGWKLVSTRIVQRFPTNRHLVESGLITEEELKVFESVASPNGKFWLPITWIQNLLMKCKDQGLLHTYQVKQLIKELQSFRYGVVMLLCYDWISVPLVYTQVVTIASYGYFAICLIGRQEPRQADLDLYIPVFTILQFLFYMGWLHVGEDLMNPFGDDDDDFDMSYILDRNTYISFMYADSCHGQLPKCTKDPWWDNLNPKLLHTKASIETVDAPFAGHMEDFKLKEEEMAVVSPGHTDTEVIVTDESTSGFQVLVRTLAQRKKTMEEAESRVETEKMGSTYNMAK